MATLTFYSRQLRDAERKYSTYDRELLDIYLAIRHFRYFLDGITFTVCTDHKPLVDAISKLSDPWTAKQQRHLSFISEFTTDIKHLSGKVNVVADCLSRSPINNIALGIDYTAIAQAQHVSIELQAYPTVITNLQLANMPLHPSGTVLLCDISTGTPLPIVPMTYAPLYLWYFVVMCLKHYTIWLTLVKGNFEVNITKICLTWYA